MEKFKVYKIKKRTSYFMIIIGVVLLISSLGVYFANVDLSIWRPLLFALQGSLFVFIGIFDLKNILSNGMRKN